MNLGLGWLVLAVLVFALGIMAVVYAFRSERHNNQILAGWLGLCILTFIVACLVGGGEPLGTAALREISGVDRVKYSEKLMYYSGHLLKKEVAPKHRGTWGWWVILGVEVIVLVPILPAALRDETALIFKRFEEAWRQKPYYRFVEEESDVPPRGRSEEEEPPQHQGFWGRLGRTFPEHFAAEFASETLETVITRTARGLARFFRR